MKLLSSHVIHFVLMGVGMALVLGMIKPTSRWERTKRSMLKHVLGFIGVGLVLAWVMYLLPTAPIRF